jgi:hypothetical protein
MSDPNAWQMPTYYSRNTHFRLALPFEGSERIPHNYSQCYQDMFVLTMLNGKVGGTYVEIGSGDPFVSNNTALLERFGWTGISLEINEDLVDKFNAGRQNLVACGDATEVDYDELFTEVGFTNTDFDYLQVDCEPASTTFAALKKIPHDKYRFAVITYEHDSYAEGNKVRDESREFLSELGYILIGSNISVDEFHPYEDWWVHPELVDMERAEKLRNDDDNIKKGESFCFGEYS